MNGRPYLVTGAKIVNEGRIFDGSVLISDERITEIIHGDSSGEILSEFDDIELIDGRGKFLLPGIIDDQVHFRDPGFPEKGDMATESRAAVAGGVTTFMDMPNTDPKAVTLGILEEKFRIAASKSVANYSFFLGASNDNLAEIEKADPKKICGVKVFLGSSTGNMLVDDPVVLEQLFRRCRTLVAIHSEDETIIKENLQRISAEFHGNIPVEMHPVIRNTEACFASSQRAVQLARQCGTRLHILHLSTAKELSLLDDTVPLKEKRITGEVCVHHLWYDDRDYAQKGSLIKCNPAIKSQADKDGLLQGVLNDKIDIIATDHAPHLMEEKQKPYLQCPSGIPLVQHALVAMLELCHKKKISLEKIVEKMSHSPAILYKIKDRGFIRKGCFADLVLVDLHNPWTVDKANLLYKCGWSPFEGQKFTSRVTHTFVNGNLVFRNGTVNDKYKGKRLEFYI